MDLPRIAGLAVGTLAAGDLDAAQRLVEESRWNQVRADWELFLAQGTAFKVNADDGTLVATAAVLPYAPRFGWISMVLVTASHRRRGIATVLLQHCMATLRSEGLVPVLDATPAGREVYRPLGFRDGWGITRWRRATGSGNEAVVVPAVRALADLDWPQIAALDARAFGADRLPLLRSLHARSRPFACVIEQQGRITGYLLGREGRVATQLGPIVAPDAQASQALLAHALQRVQGTVLVDVLDVHAPFAQALAQADFAIERPYTRMTLDRHEPFGDAALTVAIAGPELG
jgi:GNAT superfamily N-acetyltransferase